MGGPGKVTETRSEIGPTQRFQPQWAEPHRWPGWGVDRRFFFPYLWSIGGFPYLYTMDLPYTEMISAQQLGYRVQVY